MSSKPLTNRLIITILSESVSNINGELAMYYPELNQPAHEHFDALKALGVLRLRAIMGEDVTDEIKFAQVNLVRTTSVRSYNARRNAEVSFDLEFDDLCNSMNKEGNVDVRTMSIREFYSLFNYIKKQRKSNKGKTDKFL